VFLAPDGGLPSSSGPVLPGAPGTPERSEISFEKRPATFTPAATPAPVDEPDEYVLAGWGARVVATILDQIVILVFAIPLGIGLMVLFGVTTPFHHEPGYDSGGDSDEFWALRFFVGMLLFAMAAFVVSLIYPPLWMTATKGKTLGKQATGIRVVRANGQPVGFFFSLAREVGLKWTITWLLGSITFWLAPIADGIWPLIDGQRRALHDFAMNSRVVRG
jgi:uncharacterized RDD family membrane protein YckC